MRGPQCLPCSNAPSTGKYTYTTNGGLNNSCAYVPAITSECVSPSRSMYGLPTIYAQGEDQKNLTIQSTILPVGPATSAAGNWPTYLTAPTTFFSNSPQSYTSAVSGFELSNNNNRSFLLEARRFLCCNCTAVRGACR